MASLAKGWGRVVLLLAVAELMGGVSLIGCGKQPSHPDAGTAGRPEAMVAVSGSGVSAASGTTGGTHPKDTRPPNDQQHQPFDENLLVSLTHDGRFAEARAIEKEARAAGYKQWLPWFRLHLAERDWDGAFQIVEEHRKADKKDKTTPSYLAALIYLKQGNAARALPEVEVLQQAFREHRQDKKLEYRLWEVQGLYMCQTGAADAGLKLLAKAAERSKDDYGHHAWRNGAYFMEIWGIAALQADRPATAEKALLEALAHDPGSVRAALGLQVLCEQQGRSDEARRYADLARRCWNRSDQEKLQAELDALRAERYSARW
jgi:hypothetical protein